MSHPHLLKVHHDTECSRQTTISSFVIAILSMLRIITQTMDYFDLLQDDEP